MQARPFENLESEPCQARIGTNTSCGVAEQLNEFAAARSSMALTWLGIHHGIGADHDQACSPLA